MREQTRALDTWDRGEPLDHDKLNQSVDALNRLRGIAPPQQVHQRQYTITKQFKIVSIENDYIVCDGWNGFKKDGSQTKVAKPYLLRKTPFVAPFPTGTSKRRGITYVYSGGQARTATLGSDEESQVIVPSYEVGDVIYAHSVIVLGTDTKESAAKTAVELAWIDANVDARAWAKVASE